LRILHLTNHAREIGNGIVNVAVDLAHGQAAAGNEVHFGSAGGEYEKLLAEGGVVHHHLPVPGASPEGMLSVLAFQRLVRKIRPDIVHVHMVKWAIVSRLCSFLNRYATVATVHNVYQRSSRVMGGCDAVVALGGASREIIRGWGVPARRIHVVVNAPLGSPRLPSPDLTVPARMESPSIVSVGGLFHRKGFAFLIEAFSSVLLERPSASLHIVGEGPDRAFFEEQASRISKDRIVFHGFQADPLPFLKGADLVVLASLRESFPLVLLEAREFGSRIVATDVDGNREALDGGAAGALVEPANARSLSRAILTALDAPVRSAVREGLDRYRVPALVRRTDEIYRIAGSRRP
jgi:glycosyltransferase involved in cell wall biosynthesis